MTQWKIIVIYPCCKMKKNIILILLLFSKAHNLSASNDSFIAGPTLVFRGISKENSTFPEREWIVSALAVTSSKEASLPSLSYLKTEVEPNIIEIESVGRYTNYRFLRYIMRIKMGNTEQKITYKIGSQTAEFYVPGIDESPHILYTSCNDMDKEKTDQNWETILHQHKNKHVHLGLGGGDQIYCDNVLKIQNIKILLEKNDQNKSFMASSFEENLSSEVTNFYVENYIRYLQKPAYKKALASIPHLNMNDDHEIFDGWGSYPAELQNCPIMQGIFQIGQKTYLGFQHHISDIEDAYQYGYITNSNKPSFEPFKQESFSFLHEINQYAILGLDQRGERTRQQIMSQDAYDKIFTAIKTLSSQCQHLLLMIGVPIIFPKLNPITDLLDKADPYSEGTPIFKKIAYKLAIAVASSDIFGFAEPTDDLLYDHWGYKNHKEERDNFIRKIMQFSYDRFLQKIPIRVSLLSGDIHLGSTGIITPEKPFSNMTQNPFFIRQLVSSGIGSKWDSALLLNFIEGFASRKIQIKKGGEIPSINLQNTKWETQNGTKVEKYFVNSRNWMYLNLQLENNISNLIAQLYMEDSSDPFKIIILGLEKTGILSEKEKQNTSWCFCQ